MFAGKRGESLVAATLLFPFVALFVLFFVYPIIQMFLTSLTDAPLIGSGSFIGLDNYVRALLRPDLIRSFINTAYFVLLTVVPQVVLALLIAMGVNRQKGWVQSAVLACFFLPSILPVSVVTATWTWMFDVQYGVLMPFVQVLSGGRKVPLFRSSGTFMPIVAIITIWWGIGFGVLLFIAALRNISADIYEAAALDNANRRRVFLSITWPLIWPVTALLLTLGLIAQLKVFDQIYLLGGSARADTSSVLLKSIYVLAFQQNKGGEACAVSVLVFVLIVVLSIVQTRLLSAGKGKK
jgi:multiple sugar transport system permease protein